MTALAPHITAFFEQLLPLERGASEHTRDSYAYAFKLFLTYASTRLTVAPSELTVEQMDAPLVVDFLHDLETTRGNSPSSRNIRLAAIKSFMHFLEYRVPAALERIRRILAIPIKKTESRLVGHLTLQEMQALLDAPDPTTRAGIRDRAMLHVCYAAGLRVSELIGIRLDDLIRQPQPTLLVHGKGRRERCLPVCQCAWRIPHAFRHRIHPAQVRPDREATVPLAPHKARVPAPTEAHLRAHGAPRNQRPPKRFAVARPPATPPHAT